VPVLDEQPVLQAEPTVLGVEDRLGQEPAAVLSCTGSDEAVTSQKATKDTAPRSGIDARSRRTV